MSAIRRQKTEDGRQSSALTFELKYRPDQRVDMSPLVCHLLKDLELPEIAALTLQSGKCKLRVDELFTITGSDAQTIVIKNSFAKLDFIGKELQGGSITVEGDAGAYLGFGMKSGEIKAMYQRWFMSPIPPKNVNLKLPISHALEAQFKAPTDRGAE